MYMRDATQEETKSVNEYIKSISTDTGVDFYDIEKSLKEIRELREYKSKVEKFISKNKNIFLRIPVYVLVKELKEELGYEEER